MSARPPPERPDLDQLKRQAKELLRAYRAADPEARSRWAAHASAERSPQVRLRDAQRVLARAHGFPSWDALRAHVVAQTGAEIPETARPRRGLDYDDPVPGAIDVREPLTRDAARRLAEAGVTAVRIDSTIPAAALAHLAEVTTLRGLEITHRDDLVDRDLAFLEAMPQLTALSLSRCRGITDDAVAYLRGHRELEQVNLQWTASGDAAVAMLAGKPALHRVVLGSRLTDRGAAGLREFPALRAPVSADSFLAVSSSALLTDQALTHLGDLAGVVALDVHYSIFGSPHFTARGVAHLRRMTALEQLNFNGNWATDAVLHELAVIPRLRWLHCQDIVAGDEGFLALSESATLEELGARFCRSVTDRGYAALARLPRLRSLGLGGPRISDGAMAAMVDAPALTDLEPNLFGDSAFESIARIPRLRKLTNMYNRDTTDAATAHLRGHPRLEFYSAFGTQITDESLRILAGIETLETVQFENCRGITDAGMRAMAGLPRLRKLSVWSCVGVSGSWRAAARPEAEASSEDGTTGQVDGYRFETLLDYPDLPVPDDVTTAPTGLDSDPLSRAVLLGCRAEPIDGGLCIEFDQGPDRRWFGLLTREAFAVPLRIELEARPIEELHLSFGRSGIVFDLAGAPEIGKPTYLPRVKMSQTDEGLSYAGGAPPDSEWWRIVLEMAVDECRLFVNGELRHLWRDDYTGRRSRLGLGPRQTAVTVRGLTVQAAPGHR